MKNNYLSEREMNVMQVLWKYENPMTVTEIVESEKELTTPTVHTVLRKLLDKGYVQVIDTVQTGKVFARRYKAKKTQDEEIEEKIKELSDMLELEEVYTDAHRSREIFEEKEKLEEDLMDVYEEYEELS